jgi:phosphotransferase system enzyme I (PtsI)
MKSEKRIEPREVKLSGISISPGIAFGYIHLIDPILPAVHSVRIPDSADAQDEVSKLERALEEVRNSIHDHVEEYHAIAGRDSEEIIAAHILMLEDHEFFSGIKDRIISDHLTAERALREAFSIAAGALAEADDPYLSARAEDLRDICQNLRLVLIHGPSALKTGKEDFRHRVMLSYHMYPSDILRARRRKAAAFITSCKTYTSHGAILLRASALPAVGGLEFPERPLGEKTPVLVDADRGEVILWPRPKTVEHTLARLQVREGIASREPLPPTDAQTNDGVRVALWANIDNPSQIQVCFQQRLRGIGLFRTEFFALEHGRIPDETIQYQAYRSIMERLAGRPLVIRTFDIGADKVAPGLDECQGQNPALGIRGIRRHLVLHREEFRTQIRAILRASVDSVVSVLFPMVTHAGDIRRAKACVEQVASELDREGIPFNRSVKFGAMVEVPSAAFGIDHILEVVDFASVGTNDLMQYFTASDRDNTAVIEYQNPRDAGFFQLMEHIMDRARMLGRERDVHVCGDLASDPDAAVTLIRLGFTSLSVNPVAAARIRKAIEQSG